MQTNFNHQPRTRSRGKSTRKHNPEFYVPTPKIESADPTTKKPNKKTAFKRQLLQLFISGACFAGGVLAVMVIVMYLFRGAIQ